MEQTVFPPAGEPHGIEYDPEYCRQVRCSLLAGLGDDQCVRETAVRGVAYGRSAVSGRAAARGRDLLRPYLSAENAELVQTYEWMESCPGHVMRLNANPLITVLAALVESILNQLLAAPARMQLSAYLHDEADRLRIAGHPAWSRAAHRWIDSDREAACGDIEFALRAVENGVRREVGEVLDFVSVRFASEYLEILDAGELAIAFGRFREPYRNTAAHGRPPPVSAQEYRVVCRLMLGTDSFGEWLNEGCGPPSELPGAEAVFHTHLALATRCRQSSGERLWTLAGRANRLWDLQMRILAGKGSSLPDPSGEGKGRLDRTGNGTIVLHSQFPGYVRIYCFRDGELPRCLYPGGGASEPIPAGVCACGMGPGMGSVDGGSGTYRLVATVTREPLDGLGVPGEQVDDEEFGRFLTALQHIPRRDWGMARSCFSVGE